MAALRARALEPVAAEVAACSEQLAEVVRRLEEVAARIDRVERELEDSGRDRWTARAVGLGDRVLVGCRHLGLSYLMRSDDLLLLPQFLAEGDYERGTTEYLKRTVPVDGVAVDVGANFGYYTCLLARLAWRGRVVAVEPDPDVFDLLRDNVTANWCVDVVTPVNAAVSDRAGTVTLHRRPTRTGNTSIAAPTEHELSRSDRPAEPFDVTSTTLDELTADLDRVDVVKIDVEGAEPLVLAGAEELVGRHAPRIVMEWSPTQIADAGFSPEEVVAQLERLGLRVSRILPDGSLAGVELADLVGLDYQNVVIAR